MLIGMDPDNKKSGLAVFEDNKMTLHLYGIVQLLEFLLNNKDRITMAFLEAGWLNKSIHHAAPNKAVKANIGVRVGINFGYGKVIEDFLSAHRIPYKTVRPTAKTKKLNQHQFRQVTGYSKRNGQEVRDAAMLVIRAKGDEALRGVTRSMLQLGVIRAR